MLRKLHELADVVEGKAHVIKVPKRVADRYKGLHDVSVVRNRVVMPRMSKTERARFNKRSGNVDISRFERGKKVRILRVGARNMAELEAFDKANPGLTYALRLPRAGGWETFRFSSVGGAQGLAGFLKSSPKLEEAADNLAEYVDIEDYEAEAATAYQEDEGAAIGWESDEEE